MSFAVNQLIGFGARRASAAGGVETLVDRTTGTAFGDMNNAGGSDLAFAFDGTTSQAHTASAGRPAGASVQSGEPLPSFTGSLSLRFIALRNRLRALRDSSNASARSPIVTVTGAVMGWAPCHR